MSGFESKKGISTRDIRYLAATRENPLAIGDCSNRACGTFGSKTMVRLYYLDSARDAKAVSLCDSCKAEHWKRGDFVEAQ